MLHPQQKQTPRSPQFPSLISTQDPPSSGIVNVFKTRSNEGFERFLRCVYVNKNTRGIFLSVKSYLSNLSKYMKLIEVREERFHQLSEFELKILFTTKFFDKKRFDIDAKKCNDITSTHHAYLEYVRYTKGLYNEVRLAA